MSMTMDDSIKRWTAKRKTALVIGNIPPAEAEENFYAQRDVLDMVA